MAGLQCVKLLWWRVHEPGAPELVAEPSLQALFDRGHRVGEAARTYVPGGVLIDLPHHPVEPRVAATQAALAAGAPAVYEATFVSDGVSAAVDILERRRGGFALVEVKSTVETKDIHVQDAAIQLHVLTSGGVAVKRVEIMLLHGDEMEPAARATLRAELLRYCERDTLAMVRLHERLGELAGEDGGQAALSTQQWSATRMPVRTAASRQATGPATGRKPS